MATAMFLDAQHPNGSAFVIGEVGLTTALHEVGYTLTENDLDYVVIGETRGYSFERIKKAVRLVGAGHPFIVTNPDPTGPSANGPLPATGAVAALISNATGRVPYFIGKPNPLMIRSALRELGAHSEMTAMVGDRMDTDIIAGLEAGLHTVLVLSGVSNSDAVGHYPFRPSRVVGSVAVLADELEELWRLRSVAQRAERVSLLGASNSEGSSARANSPTNFTMESSLECVQSPWGQDLRWIREGLALVGGEGQARLKVRTRPVPIFLAEHGR